jgi:hypothetical protein
MSNKLREPELSGVFPTVSTLCSSKAQNPKGFSTGTVEIDSILNPVYDPNPTSKIAISILKQIASVHEAGAKRSASFKWFGCTIIKGCGGTIK